MPGLGILVPPKVSVWVYEFHGAHKHVLEMRDHVKISAISHAIQGEGQLDEVTRSRGSLQNIHKPDGLSRFLGSFMSSKYKAPGWLYDTNARSETGGRAILPASCHGDDLQIQIAMLSKNIKSASTKEHPPTQNDDFDSELLRAGPWQPGTLHRVL